MIWIDLLNADPRSWLLELDTPAVRAATLTRLLDRSADDPEVGAARRAAMRADPIRAILQAQLPSGAWAKLGFPSAYVTEVLQNLETLAELGRIDDPRAARAVDWVAAQQDAEDRWLNRYAYNGKTTVDIDKQGKSSKWVTLRACTVLQAAVEQR